MLNRKVFLAIAIMALLLGLLAGACQGAEGKQGPKGDTGAAGAQGPKGDKGDPGTSPSEADIKTVVETVLVGEAASAESIAKGGLLYDKWWKAAGVDQPAGDQPLWALQASNTRTGGDTWRCKECHGWDYKGVGGAYASGSHKTGFSGVYQAGATMSKDELVGVLQGSLNYRHDFSAMGADNLADLANFLSEGLINDAMYIDYASKAPKNANTSNGQTLYTSACSMCHGADGAQILFGGKDSIGVVAKGNPWEVLHKIRAGQPASAMPSSIVNGWSLQDALDVLGYAQTLP